MKPFQDIVGWSCFGCGSLNEQGLQAKSRWQGDEMVCEWHPEPHHCGHPGKFHHGLTATIMFCHGAWTATATAYRNEGREIEDPLEYFYVNRRIAFDVLAPIPIDSMVTIRARVTRLEGQEADVLSIASAGGTDCAKAETHLVRVSAADMEF